MKSNTYFKDAALAALRGNWGKAVLVTLVLIVITLFFSSPGIYTSYKTQAYLEGYSMTSVSDIMDMGPLLQQKRRLERLPARFRGRSRP